MDKIVFGDYTVQDLVVAGLLVLGLLIGMALFKKIFGKRNTEEHSQMVACRCGWRGRVSRYAGRCPQCNRPLGEQKARPPTSRDR